MGPPRSDEQTRTGPGSAHRDVVRQAHEHAAPRERADAAEHAGRVGARRQAEPGAHERRLLLLADALDDRLDETRLVLEVADAVPRAELRARGRAADRVVEAAEDVHEPALLPLRPGPDAALRDVVDRLARQRAALCDARDEVVVDAVHEPL